MNDFKNLDSGPANQSTSHATGRGERSPSKALASFLPCAVFLWATLSAGASPRQAVGSSTAHLNPGDILFTDSEAAVLRLDAVTGQTSLLAGGGMLVRPCGIALGPDQTIYVTDTGCLAVIAINPATGESAVLSSGGLLGVPFGIAVNAQGEVFVANSQALLGINPVDGTQRTVSSGGVLKAPLGVAVAPNGDLYVADAGGAVVRIDPVSGAQTVVSSGQNMITPVGIVVADARTIYVSDSTSRRLIQVDPHSGAQRVLSAEGSLTTPFGLALAGKHDLLVGDPDAFGLAGGIIHIDLRNGAQSAVVTGSGNFVNYRCVAVVPGSPTQP